MTLSNDMRRLGQDFLKACDERMAAVMSIRASTVQELTEFYDTRQTMAAEQREWLTGYIDGLRYDVDEMRHDAVTFLKELDAAHQAMATEQHQRLSEQADGLRRDTATFLEELDAAHQTMATEQRERLAAERERLAAEWAHLASDVAAMRDRLQADQDEARRVWSGFATLIRQRRAAKPAAPPPPPPMEEVAPPPAVEAPPEVEEEEIVSDDLTAIRWIGPGMQSRLNAAGIYTFAQLARSTPKELRQILGEAGQMAKVEEWIAQAQELTGLA